MAARTDGRSLQLKEDPDFHRAQARLATVTWLTLLGVMLAAALGVFGNGLLSRGHAGSAGAIRVDYQRFGRFGASMQMVVHPAAASGGAVELGISQSLLDAFQVVSVQPTPESSAIVAGGVEYRFPAQVAGPITFHVQPVRRWRVEGSVWSSRSSARVSQFIYP